MELEELALCTREEFEQELNRLCPCSVDGMNPGEFDAAFEERVRIRRSVKWLRIEALLDGKLTVDQIADQERDGDEDLRGFFKKVLEKLKEEKDRDEIIEETFDLLELL